MKQLVQLAQLAQLVTFVVIVLISLWGNSARVSAQTLDDTQSCFEFYDYGKARAQLAFEKSSYKSREKAKLVGTLINDNTFPLVNVMLYAQLKRKNTQQALLSDGHFIVDKFRLLKNLSFLPGERKYVTVDVPILPNHPTGDYELQYYLLSEYGFHYGGRPFLEEDTAGVSTVHIEGESGPVVYIDPSRLTVNGEAHHIRESIHEYAPGPVSFALPVIDDRAERKPLTVEVSYYRFEDTFDEDSFVSNRILVRPEDPVIRSVFIPPGPGAYVFVARSTDPVKSKVKYRFAIAGDSVPDLRMGDLGVTGYPATPKDKAYVCFQAPAPQKTPDTAIELSVLDANKKPIGTTTVHGTFDGTVRAISLPMGVPDVLRDFWVQATFTDTTSRKEIRKTSVHYSCDLFSSSLSELALAPNQDDNRVINIIATNTCGKNINKDATLSLLKISQGSKVVHEIYNTRPIPASYVFSSSAAPGQYHVEAQAGRIKKTLDIELRDQIKTKEPQKSTISAIKDSVLAYKQTILLFLSSFFAFGLVIILWQMKKGTPHSS